METEGRTSRSARMMEAAGVSPEDLAHGATIIAPEQEDDLPRNSARGEDGVREESPEIVKLRDPQEQWRILNPETIELHAEVLTAQWTCDRPEPHLERYDEEHPRRCLKCGASTLKIVADSDVLEDRWLKLSLGFTRNDIYRRKVYETIEGLAMVVRAEMMRRDPALVVEMTDEWLAKNKGYFEVGVASPRTRTAAREALAYLYPGELATTIEGLTDQALTFAILALMRRRTAYMAQREEREKKQQGQPLGSATSTSS